MQRPDIAFQPGNAPDARHAPRDAWVSGRAPVVSTLEGKAMIKDAVRTLVLTVLTLTVHAESLVAPGFPSPPKWDLKVSRPVGSNDGQKTAQVDIYHPSGSDPAAPRTLVTVTSTQIPGPNIGPLEHFGLLAQGMNQGCETLRVTRPTVGFEKGASVTYGRLYCAKLKNAANGVIQSLKVLKGKERIYTVFREWHVPAFRFTQAPLGSEAFALEVFATRDDALIWLREFDDANRHLTNEVYVCPDESPDACKSK